jgi:hypothetical protein
MTNKLPEWFLIGKIIKSYCAADVALLFGYGSGVSLNAAARNGYFPKSDCVLSTSRNGVYIRKKTKKAWSRDLLITEWNKRFND